jgi:hypothetical protein
LQVGFSENLSDVPLNLKNFFVNAFMGIALAVGRRYWIHHWFGFTYNHAYS